MRLSTLGRLASSTAGLLFVSAAVADAYGHGQLRTALLITSVVMFAPVALYLMLFLPAKPPQPTPAALPSGVSTPALPTAAAPRPTALAAAQARPALTGRRRPSPHRRRDQAALPR